MRSRMIAYSLGIMAVCWFPVLPHRLWLYSLLIPLLILRRRKPVVGCYLLLVLLGCCYGVEYGYRLLNSQIPARYEEGEFWLRGDVIGLPVMNQRAQRFRVRVDSLRCIDDPQCQLALRTVQLSWYQLQTVVEPGQQVQLRVKLKRPWGVANPGGFDYQSWLIQQGIGAVGYVRRDENNRLSAASRFSLDYWRGRIRQVLDVHLAELKYRGIIKALLIGDKTAISARQWQLFSTTNTTHLMVISGLHIGLMAAVGFYFGRIVAIGSAGRLAPDRCAAVLSLLSALAYSAAAGFSLPTQRALVMVVVFMLGKYRRRELPVAQGLSLALLLCLLLDPLAPVTLSFWLSFSAVAVILYGVCGRLGGGFWRRALLSQYLVFIGLLPLLAFLLGQLSLLSPIANVLLVPLFSLLIVPLNFFAFLLLPMVPLWSMAVYQWLDSVLGLCLDFLGWLAHSGQYSLLRIPAIDPIDLLLAVAGVLIMLMPRAVPLRFAGCLLMLPLLLSKPPAIAPGDMDISVIDVGQGLSILVETADHRLLYDIGPAYSDSFSAATATVIPYLHHRGITVIDSLVLSHGDNDHSGNWPLFLSGIDVTEVFYGERLTPRALAVDFKPCVSGLGWNWDGVDFVFLHPMKESIGAIPAEKISSNNHSCVLKIIAGSTALLITGDIERRVELQLRRIIPSQLPADILIAPHHGSKTSSSWPFIRQVAARYVVFSSGYRNRFKHPASDVSKRYRLLNSVIYNTAEEGAIRFQVKKGKIISLSGYRSQLKRYWL